MTWLREHWRKVVLVAIAVVLFDALNRLLPSIDVETALHDISDTLGAFAYPLAAVTAFLETGAFVGLLVPGETVIVLAGAVAGQGATSIWLTILVVWIGAFVGDSTSFIIGRRLGRGFALRHGGRIGITPERLGSVERYFARYGGRTVVIGRFIGFVRALAPFIAGTSRMPYRTYVPYGLGGTCLWAVTFCLLGYFLSTHVNEAVHIAGKAGFWLGVVGVIVVAIVLGLRYVGRADEGERYRVGIGGGAILAVGATAAVITFALVVGAHPAATGMDSSAFHTASDIRAGWLTDVAKGVTALGSAVTTLAIAAVAGVALAVRRRWRELAVLGVAVLITQVGVSELKAAVDRPRPAGSLVDTVHSAYPSGHSAHAVIYLWLGLLVALRTRIVVGAATLVLAVLVVVAVGLTRIYLRAHFFTDVLGGWALGVVAFAIPATVALLVARVGNNQSDAATAR